MLSVDGADGAAPKEALGSASMIGGAAALLGVIVGLLLIGHAFKTRARSRGAIASRTGGPPVGGVGLDAVRADAEELAQRLASMLDAKAERLEALLVRADESIARLERAEADAGGVAPGGAGGEAPGDARLAVASKAKEEIEQAHREVYELADRGMSVLEISRRVNRPTGQVELILSLRRSAHAAAQA